MLDAEQDPLKDNLARDLLFERRAKEYGGIVNRRDQERVRDIEQKRELISIPSAPNERQLESGSPRGGFLPTQLKNLQMGLGITHSAYTGQEVKDKASPQEILNLAERSPKWDADFERYIPDNRYRLEGGKDFDQWKEGEFPQWTGGKEVTSDEWFYKDPTTGSYVPHTDETRQQYPQNVKMFTTAYGKMDALAKRGEGHLQFTQDNPYTQPHLQYDDPAYLQLTQPDGGVEEAGSRFNLAVGTAVKDLTKHLSSDPSKDRTPYGERHQPSPTERNPNVVGLHSKSGTLPLNQMTPGLKKQLSSPSFGGTSWTPLSTRPTDLSSSGPGVSTPLIAQGGTSYGKVDSLNAFPKIPTEDEFRRPNESYDDWGKRTGYGRKTAAVNEKVKIRRHKLKSGQDKKRMLISSNLSTGRGSSAGSANQPWGLIL